MLVGSMWTDVEIRPEMSCISNINERRGGIVQSELNGEFGGVDLQKIGKGKWHHIIYNIKQVKRMWHCQIHSIG